MTGATIPASAQRSISGRRKDAHVGRMPRNNKQDCRFPRGLAILIESSDTEDRLSA